ncbi:MAG: ribonuclease J, partial [Neofamilia sp.]
KIVLSGRSMINVVGTARELGILKVEKDSIIDINDIRKYEPHELTFITTGSQGEPFSALTRISNGEHRKIQVTKEDVVILSASSIPGNELAIGGVINNLMSRGTEVVYEALSEIHVSGHAREEELKLIMNITKPKYLIPFHGEMMQMKAHEKIAMKMGMPEENILMIENGDVLEFDHKGMKIGKSVQAGNVLIDGLGIGDVGNIVLRDRKWLSEDGLIIVVVTLSKDSGKLLAGPDIVSRGFVYVRESGDLMDDAKQVINKTLKKLEDSGNSDWNTMKNDIKEDLKNFIYNEIQRKPMILPIIMEV